MLILNFDIKIKRQCLVGSLTGVVTS